MTWTNATKQPFPNKEGWYLCIVAGSDGQNYPIALYYAFSWVVPEYLMIIYYTPITDLPVEMNDRIF